MAKNRGKVRKRFTNFLSVYEHLRTLRFVYELLWVRLRTCVFRLRTWGFVYELGVSFTKLLTNFAFFLYVLVIFLGQLTNSWVLIWLTSFVAGWRTLGKITKLLWTFWSFTSIQEFANFAKYFVNKSVGESMNLRQKNRNLSKDLTKLKTWQRQSIQKIIVIMHWRTFDDTMVPSE